MGRNFDGNSIGRFTCNETWLGNPPMEILQWEKHLNGESNMAMFDCWKVKNGTIHDHSN